MDLEMKFLVAFYTVLATVTAGALLVVLTLSAEVAAMLVVVLAMFAMMGVLFVAGRDSGENT